MSLDLKKVNSFLAIQFFRKFKVARQFAQGLEWFPSHLAA